MDTPSKAKLAEIERRFRVAERWDDCQPSGEQRAQLKRVIELMQSLIENFDKLQPAIGPSIDLALNSAFGLEDPALSWVPHGFMPDTDEGEAQESASDNLRMETGSDEMDEKGPFGRAYLIATLAAAERTLNLLHIDSGEKGRRLEKQSLLVGFLLEAYEDQSGITATRSVNGAFYKYCISGLELLADRLSMPELHNMNGIEDSIRREIEFPFRRRRGKSAIS